MTARFKLDFNGFWLGFYCKPEHAHVQRPTSSPTRWHLEESWRRRVCVSLVPFVTLVLSGRWRNAAGQVI